MHNNPSDHDETMIDDSHHPPAPTAYIRCTCGHVGAMKVHQTAPGCHGSTAGPPEPPTFAATCRCGEVHELHDDLADCDGCGCACDPDRLMDVDGDRLCLWCRREAWERAVVQLIGGLP